MRELVEHVAGLDAVASESLKVVGLFDALVEARAGLEGIVRAAAGFAAVPAGLVAPERRIAFRVDAAGARQPVAAAPGELAARWPNHPIPGGYAGLVWLERHGAPATGDHLVLERLAIAVGSSLDRLTGGLPDPAAAVAALLDPDAPAARREQAARLLGLPPAAPARVVATPPGRRGAPLPARTAIVHTPAGPVRATVVTGTVEAPARAGIGPAEPVTALHPSLDGAVAALRLTTARTPVLRADDLGLLAAVTVAPVAHLRAVVAAIGGLLDQPWGPDTLHALATTDSVRAAAAVCGVHHSTMQSRCEQVGARLGYDPRTPAGRVRLALDLAAHRLTTVRFSLEG